MKNEELYRQNKDLLLKIDGLIGEKRFDELEGVGYQLIEDGADPSLLMSYYIYRFSWYMPEGLESKLKEILDNI